MATDPHVSQKLNDVNDAELPHLEGRVTIDRHTCHTIRNILSTVVGSVDGAFSHSAMRISLDGSIFFCSDVTDE